MPDRPSVLLLHGLGRSARSMRRLARYLERHGFAARNAGYPSTCHPIEQLVDEHVRPAVEAFGDAGPVHFVTHSLGGILVRAFAERHGLPAPARAVLIAPPNAGSPIADRLADRWPFTRFCGPALTDLGTHDASMPSRLGPVGDDLEVGVIAGDRPIYPWFGPWLGGPHDGLVAIEDTKVEGMNDFATVRAGHAFIMRHPDVLDLTLRFLRHGRFGGSTEPMRNGAAG